MSASLVPRGCCGGGEEKSERSASDSPLGELAANGSGELDTWLVRFLGERVDLGVPIAPNAKRSRSATGHMTFGADST